MTGNEQRRSKNIVHRSISGEGDARCVDIFERADRSFGFEEYRRDPEEGRGWYAVGYFANQSFVTIDTALMAARQQVAWLAAVAD